MKKLRKISLLLLVAGVIISCDQNHQSQSNRHVVKNNHPINTDRYWITEGYQVFQKYGLALKAPVRLQNVNRQSKGNFDLHFGEFIGNKRTNVGTYYEIISIKIPDYSKYSEVNRDEYAQDFLDTHLERKGGKDYLLNATRGTIHGKVVSYSEQGRNAKAFAFVKNGNLITLNVISDHSVKPLFENYINSLVFYEELHDNILTDDNKVKRLTDVSSSPQSTKNENFKYYSNRQHRFSIGYPKEWRPVNFQGVVFSARSDRNNDNFNVVVISSDNRSLEEVTRLNQTELKRNLPRLEIISEDTGIINGLKYTGTVSQVYNPSVQGMQFLKTYCFVENRKAYIITFGSTDENRDSFNKIIDEIIQTFQLM